MTRFRHETIPEHLPVTPDGLRRLQLAIEAQIVAAGASGVTTFNTRSGIVVLLSGDVTTALGYTPVNPALLGSAAYSDTTDFEPSGQPGYLPVSIVDLPLADAAEPLFRWKLPVALTFTGGIADAAAGATGSPALPIKKNGAANGNVSFAGTTGTVSFTSGSYGAGDIFELYPPASTDATLDRVSITFTTT
jgi:hypothetical protein